MPFISTKVNIKLSPENIDSLKREFGQAISILPGKSENYLMLSFEDNCTLFFRGSSESPIAFVEVKLFGRASANSYEKLTQKLTSILNDVLNIPPANIYIKYEETEYWGWNGANF